MGMLQSRMVLPTRYSLLVYRHCSAKLDRPEGRYDSFAGWKFAVERLSEARSSIYN